MGPPGRAAENLTANLNKFKDKEFLRIRETGRTSTSLLLVGSMARLPTDLDCLLACRSGLERVMEDYEQSRECSNISYSDRTFYNCYFR